MGENLIIPDKLGNNPLHRMRNRIAAEILEEQWNVNYQVNKKYIATTQYIPFLSLNVATETDIAVVVGAGPSLSRNLQDLKYLPMKDVTFFCTDKAFPRMSAIDIQPLYVCALNAKSPNKEVCDWWKQGRTASSILLMPLTTDPITLESWQGKYSLINIGLPIDLTDRITSETGLRPISGGSNVGVFSYLLATRLGFKTIVLLGMDYSFENKEQVIAKYQPGEPYIIMEHRDKAGNIRWTSWDWFDSAIAFFEYARFFAVNGTRTINASDGGIIYDQEYIEEMTLEEAGNALRQH